MNITHRVSVFITPEMRTELSRFGISVNEGFSTFEVDESHAFWASLENWIYKYQAVDVVRTKFSKKEINAASWFEVIPDWHHGYPQPDEDNFGYLQHTFDLSEYCECCGIGAKQEAPFQMKAEPKWGKKDILQLNWVFDEFFAKPEIWKKYFEPYDVPFYKVTDKKGEILKTVVQLTYMPPKVDIVVDGLDALHCECCGRTKFLPTTKGLFPALASTPTAHLVKTNQYFGTGAAAHRRVLVSSAIAMALISDKVRGVTFRPVAD